MCDADMQSVQAISALVAAAIMVLALIVAWWHLHVVRKTRKDHHEALRRKMAVDDGLRGSNVARTDD